MNLFRKKEDKLQATINQLIKQVEQFNKLEPVENAASPNEGLRSRIASMISGGYDWADTLHNIYLDFGYPDNLQFDNYWNMYRRFGIAKNVVELPVDTGWVDNPEVKANEAFLKEFEKLVEEKKFWIRMKGLDTRQRVGRYAGMYMRVNDGKTADQPIEGTLSGIGSLVEMMPLYESQLEVLETDQDQMSETFGQPKMYQYSGSAEGSRNKDTTSTINIHASRVVIAAEDADNGWIYGISSLEAPYNSLMDLRKIIGAGGEGFYKNASQSVVFGLKDGASGKVNSDLLDGFNEKFDEFQKNRARRGMWAPGMDVNVLSSSLANPKEFFMNALNDVAAGTKIPATILIGQQTGRLASTEDGRNYLSTINSRRANFMTEMTLNVIAWLIKYGILPASEIELEWTDLLARSDEEKLDNSDKMASINEKQFKSGESTVFTSEEIREAAGFEPEEEEEPGTEEVDDDDAGGAE